MLSLQNSYLGSPSGPLHSLVLPKETLLLYPACDAVVILNARSLALVRVLAFWEAFPGTGIVGDQVSCLSVDSGMKLIVVALKSRIATWALSGVHHDSWRVHSSLVLPPDSSVTALDSKSGLLAVATESSLSVYTLILENDLPTWSQKWTSPTNTRPIVLHFSPSLMYIATISKLDYAVRIYSTTSGCQTQLITHPRPILDITWRDSRDDQILYTITSDSTLRIFLAVLDSPRQLQLHAALNLFSSLPFSVASTAPASTIFWLDREILNNSLSRILRNASDPEDARYKRLQEIKDEGWDLFLHVLEDGSVVITAVAHVDRRPPTLLKHFTLQHSLPSAIPQSPSYLALVPLPGSTSITLVTSSPLRSYELSPLSFFDSPTKGLTVQGERIDTVENEQYPIAKFVRTPEGRGVAVLRSNGSGEVWKIVSNKNNALVKSGSWNTADYVVVLDCGNSFATYSSSTCILTLCSCSGPGRSTLAIPAIQSLFTVPSFSRHETIIGITEGLEIVHIHVTTATEKDALPMLSVHSHNSLPLPHSPKIILPVDPMAWGSGAKGPGVEHDILLSVSDIGELAFWVLEERHCPAVNGQTSTSDDAWGWRCTGKVRTHRSSIRKARCSSAKKTALIVPTPGGEELTIWDSKESEFASGLEHCTISSETINDLDWSSTPDMQSILAVGYLHRVELLCQQRMTYFDDGPAWAVCWRVEIGHFIPYPISDSIWLVNGSLLMGAGHQMCLFGPQRSGNPTDVGLFEYVAMQNGPLEDHHPQMILQCLLWEKVELVKDIIVNLSKDVDRLRKDPDNFSWTSVPVTRFMSRDELARPVHNSGHRKRYTMLFNSPEVIDESDDEAFSRPVVVKLIEDLETRPLPHLTPNEQAHLMVLIQTTLEIEEQRRSLDSNGLRYLISMRSFYILNHRASAPGSPESGGNVRRGTGRRERLRYRDMIWAFHSESQDLLLNASTTACNGKMCWSDARALGISIWLSSIDAMRSQLEVIARNEYMGESRDPTACSLFYFALGKVKLVHSLWRQAAGHKEQAMMLKFLSNDFTEPRWRTAALKNAYALLSKRRFEYAAAFFLLGNSLRDAVNVCLKQLQDFQLAVALARVVEQDNGGPILSEILTKTVIPLAFKDGNRWLGSWAFWLLHRRDLAVRILVTPLQDIAVASETIVEELGEPHYDDPSLALLFSQLRSKTLQAAQGTSEISGKSEFNFVLQIARVFCRMGCHALALDLVRTWSFERPSILIPSTSSTSNNQVEETPPSPVVPRRPLLGMQHIRRRSSMVIDMDIPSLPPTRPASPLADSRPAVIKEEPESQEGDLFARKAGLGSLMKTAKQDVKIAEFDMNAFF
ncbi:RAVE protein 1 C terminal-domain-containing protein [Mycena floridula]|nr:RAVE protein 1 C terminal-domain-containing protein [Mycena floridula]